MMERSEDDPKGLIREAYRIEGITEPECRSVFLDWALSVQGDDQRERIGRLLERYGDDGHPMTGVLREALDSPARTGRRGGRAARVGEQKTTPPEEDAGEW